MEKELLEKIKSEVNDMKKIATGDYFELGELEKNPVVQRYLYLKSLTESRDLQEYGKNRITSTIIEKYGNGLIKDSNSIWCYLYQTFDRDHSKTIVVYQDLENSTKYMIIDVDKQDEFEATHNVVYGNLDIRDYNDRYYNIKHQFFEDCINDGQEIAVQKVLSKGRKK